jgi:trehalose 6-phosphate phosphatase
MAACFAGDDSGDLAAFEALDRLALRGLQTLRIAVASAETPRALLEVADHSVASPEDLLALLNSLAALAGGPVPHS